MNPPYGRGIEVRTFQKVASSETTPSLRHPPDFLSIVVVVVIVLCFLNLGVGIPMSAGCAGALANDARA